MITQDITYRCTEVDKRGDCCGWGFKSLEEAERHVMDYHDSNYERLGGTSFSWETDTPLDPEDKYSTERRYSYEAFRIGSQKALDNLTDGYDFDKQVFTEEATYLIETVNGGEASLKKMTYEVEQDMRSHANVEAECNKMDNYKMIARFMRGESRYT